MKLPTDGCGGNGNSVLQIAKSLVPQAAQPANQDQRGQRGQVPEITNTAPEPFSPARRQRERFLHCRQQPEYISNGVLYLTVHSTKAITATITIGVGMPKISLLIRLEFRRGCQIPDCRWYKSARQQEQRQPSRVTMKGCNWHRQPANRKDAADSPTPSVTEWAVTQREHIMAAPKTADNAAVD